MTMIQINGVRCHQVKLKSRKRKDILKQVMNESAVLKELNGRKIIKTIIVKDKLVNIIATKAWSNKSYYPETGVKDVT